MAAQADSCFEPGAQRCGQVISIEDYMKWNRLDLDQVLQLQVKVFRRLPLARQPLGLQLISALVERHEKTLWRQHFTAGAVDLVDGHSARFLSRERISLWSC